MKTDAVVVHPSPASANPMLNDCDCFFPKAAMHDGQSRMPPPLFRSELRTSTGRENVSFSSSKVAAEAERLRELEGHVYNMMEGVIRRRRNRDSENLNTSLEVVKHIDGQVKDTFIPFNFSRTWATQPFSMKILFCRTKTKR